MNKIKRLGVWTNIGALEDQWKEDFEELMKSPYTDFHLELMSEHMGSTG